ncbi:MAG: DUF222 domain-containing protein [Micrococcales bacterium]|nr:DUF222 domain-containing protein [Micrococcales bacterium]
MSAREILDSATRVAAVLERSGRRADSELVAALEAVGELRRLVDASGARLAAEVVRRSAAGTTFDIDRRWGERTPATLVAAHVGLEPGEALAWCEAGDALTPTITLTGAQLAPAHPALASVVSAGRVSVTAAQRIVRGLDDVAAKGATPGQLASFEQTLIDYAPTVSPRELRRLIRRMLDLVDPDGAEPREDLLRTRSGVTIVQQADGLTRLTALLHPEAAGFVLTALDARTAPRRQPAFAESGSASSGVASDDAADALDRRPLAQRRVDALVGIARDALTRDTGQVAGAPVTVMVTVTLEALTTGLGCAQLAGVDEPISAATARRHASDAGIVPVVLVSASENLDQGRETRLATPAQRRALSLRDRGCLFPHCSAPPAWCEVAHLRAWADGGPTDLNNLALLCPFHHRALDHDGWQLHWRGGQLWLIPPPHVDASRTPRPTRHRTLQRESGAA